MPVGLYLHIPFCRVHCPYCSFNVFAGIEDQVPMYLDGLEAELALRLGGPGAPERLDTVYFGGGTPSLLPAAALERLLDAIAARVPLSRDVEITVESDPGTADRDRLRAYRALGVDRLTIGCQTFDDARLRGLGRAHDAATALRSVDDARAAGFDNLDLDLMFALPGQRPEEFAADLEQALALEPAHLSLYELTLEPGTPFHRRAARGALRPADEDDAAAMYAHARERTEAAGLPRYEVSNFARPGYQSRHNRLYWEGERWEGVGAGAHGHEPRPGPVDFGRRWWNLRTPRRYAEAALRGELPEEGQERLGRAEAIDEALLAGLRLREGLDLARLEERFGLDLPRASGPVFAALLREGALTASGGRVAVSESAVAVLDAVVARLAASLEHPRGVG